MELAKYIGISTFAAERELKVTSVRTGLKRNPEHWPPFVKMGNQIRFKRTDIDAWEVNLSK